MRQLSRGGAVATVAVLLLLPGVSWGQTTIVNYDFNAGGTYAALTPVLATNVTSTASSTEAFATANGTVSGASAFAPNVVGPALTFNNSTANNPKYFQFQLGGSALSAYHTYKVYVQAQRSNSGFQTVTLAYSTDGTSFINLPSTLAPGNGSFVERVFDLSAITALDNQSSVYFRLLASGATASGGTVRIDNFEVQAISPLSPTTPVINVTQGGNDIESGSDVYNFADTNVNTNTDVTFTVENQGGAVLSLNGTPTVNITGADASDFTVTAQPTTMINGYSSTTFVIRFHPTTGGMKTAAVSIANNDPNTASSPYTFEITGQAVVPVPTFTATPNSLTYTIPVATSSTQTYALNGSNLTANATVNLASNNAAITFSLNNGVTFVSSATLTTSATGTLSQNVLVRFTAGATVNTVSAVISNTVGSLSAPVTITANATIAAPPSPPGLLLLEDDFAYTAGSALVGQGSWTVTSSATPNLQVVAGGTAVTGQAFPKFPIGALGTNNQMQLAANGGQDAKKGYTLPAGTTTLYAAAIVTVSNVGSASAGDYFLNFIDNSTTSIFRGRVFVRGSANGYQFGISNNVAAASALFTTAEYALNTPYLVIMKCVITSAANTGNIYSLFVYNGAASQTEPGTPDAGPTTDTTTGAAVLNGIALRQNGPGLTIDNLRVATGWGTAIGQPSYTDATPTINNGDYYSVASLSGNQTLTVSGPVVIENTLNLDGGKIITDNTNSLTLRDQVSTQVNSSGTSYVDGPLARQATDAPSLVFPIGKNNNYRPLTLDITAGPSTLVTYTAEQFEGAPADTLKLGSLRRVSQIRYYSVVASPPYPATPPSGFRGNISLSFGSNDGVTDPGAPEFVVAKNSGAGWESIGRSSNGLSTLTSLEFTSFSLFALGSTDPSLTNNPLPVELTRFTAERGKAGVSLKWATASEKNSAYFDVQRRSEGQASDFETVATVQAAGMGSTYSTFDQKLSTSTVYYRLRQVDRDGSAQYSGVVAVKATGSALSSAPLSFYPNPATDVVTVTNADLAGQTVSIRDLTGRELRRTVLSATGQVSLRDLAAGTYLLQVQQNGVTAVRRITKE